MVITQIQEYNSFSRTSNKLTAQGHAWSLSRRGLARRTKARNRKGRTIGDRNRTQACHPHGKHTSRARVESQ
jgi:hypothetical protein